MSSKLVSTPKPPYYAVIFTSVKKRPDEGYPAMAKRMEELAAGQKGFLGIESVRNSDGLGISVSYWQTEEDIHNWKKNEEHLIAQEMGKTKWYEHYSIRVCKVERAYKF